MPMDPDDLPKHKRLTEIVLGVDLYGMSVGDLEERIALMEAEIARCREAIGQRNATKDAAAAFFKS
jgi:uncharacterized small protein (DUF1192 family)